MTDKTKFNGWTPKIVTKHKIELIGVKTKMLEICINQNGSVEHINGLPKGYGYYVKRIKWRKKYYKKHKKRLLSWHKKYRLENRDKIIKQQKESYYKNDGAKQRSIWRSKNPLRDLKTNRKWRLNNPNKLKEYYKKNWQKIINDPILHEKNKQQAKLKMSSLKAKLRQRKSFRNHFKANRSYYKNKSQQHYLDNKTYYYIRSSNRRALKLKAIPKWANLEKIKEIYQKRKKGYHVDHIIPLQNKYVCGLHVENNLQYLKATDNLSKGNNFIPT